MKTYIAITLVALTSSHYSHGMETASRKLSNPGTIAKAPTSAQKNGSQEEQLDELTAAIAASNFEMMMRTSKSFCGSPAIMYQECVRMARERQRKLLASHMRQKECLEQKENSTQVAAPNTQHQS